MTENERSTGEMNRKNKNEYFPPEFDLIRVTFKDNLLLTGSIENDSSIIGNNDDNGDDVEFG